MEGGEEMGEGGVDTRGESGQREGGVESVENEGGRERGRGRR